MTEAVYNPVTNQYETVPGASSDTPYTANGAIGHNAGVHALQNPTGAMNMTLSNPLDSEENNRIIIVARTPFAHKVTVTGGLGGNAADDVITYAKVGDCIELMASNLRWVPVSAPYGATIT